MKGKWWILLIAIVVCLTFAVGIVFWLAVRDMDGTVRRIGIGKAVGLVKISGEIASSEDAVSEIVRLSKDPRVSALVVRIESPGGSVAAVQEIYSELKKVRGKGKPVVASMGVVAASGGYYVACAAESIIANPGTLTGSIGVIMTFANTQVLLKKIGIDVEVVKTGEYKDIGSISRHLSDEERKIVLGLLEDVHSQFIEVIAEERGIDIDTVQALADGRLLTGRQALDLGLVDRLGGLGDAIQIAARLAGIKGEPSVITERRIIGFWAVLRKLLTKVEQASRSTISLEYSLR
ncbi:MAG: signal peptide peptidase SppA [bacterium]